MAVTVLAMGMAIVYLGSRQIRERMFFGKVATYLPLPEKIPNWRLEVLPVADTPEIRAKVDELLDFDDAVFANYTFGPDRFSVYIAYWQPGKARYRDVAGHTPDTCWVSAGWETRYARGIDEIEISDELVLKHGEYRVMTRHGSKEHVLFWHIVGGKSEFFANGWPPPWYDALRDLFRMGTRMRAEQYFVRISSNRALDAWSNMPVYKELVANLTFLHEVRHLNSTPSAINMRNRRNTGMSKLPCHQR